MFFYVGFRCLFLVSRNSTFGLGCNFESLCGLQLRGIQLGGRVVKQWECLCVCIRILWVGILMNGLFL